MGSAEAELVKNNHFTEMCCGTEVGSYLRLIGSCVTQLKAQGPCRTCNESKEEEESKTHQPSFLMRKQVSTPMGSAEVELAALAAGIEHKVVAPKVAASKVAAAEVCVVNK